MKETRTTLGKALKINLDPRIYGAFAEIGAGQEVARHFFQAGKASQTIAKTISAYDMVYSDEIYGKEDSQRYVCESRLRKMLNKEFDLLKERLDTRRGERTCFFALANTVTTGTVNGKHQCHGWMGVRFQTAPHGEPNEILLHVRMLDRYRLQQQEALGRLGVNLLYAAFFYFDQQDEFINQLVDGLKSDQMSIDALKISGPDLKKLDHRLLALDLVTKGVSEAILFGPNMEVLDLSDSIWKKPLVVLRGSFHPLTKAHLSILDKGHTYAKSAFPGKQIFPLFELTTHQLGDEGEIDRKDYLNRIEAVTKTGNYLLLSQFFLFYKLKRYLRLFTQEPVAMVIGAAHLSKLFNERYYADLEGGILEGLGKLLHDDSRLYIYPHKTKDVCMTSQSFFPEPKLLPLYQFFKKEQKIIDIADCDEVDLEEGL